MNDLPVEGRIFQRSVRKSTLPDGPDRSAVITYYAKELYTFNHYHYYYHPDPIMTSNRNYLHIFISIKFLPGKGQGGQGRAAHESIISNGPDISKIAIIIIVIF